MLESKVVGWHKDLNLEYAVYCLSFAFSDGKHKPKPPHQFSEVHNKLVFHPDYVNIEDEDSGIRVPSMRPRDA